MSRLLDREKLSRRTRLYASRGFRSATGRRLRHNCLFFHLPKCGGTSLAASLYGTVPLHQRIGVIDAVSTRRAASIQNFGVDDPVRCHEDLPNGHMTFALRETLMLTHMAWNTPLIHGHVLYSDKAASSFGGTYKTVTMMRDPIERTISNFRMAVRAGIVEDDLDRWLDSPVATSMAQVYLRYFSGQNVVPDRSIEASTKRAAQNLNKFALIGFLDKQREFGAAFADLFGPRLSMPHYNNASGSSLILQKYQIKRLRNLCEPDEQLFEIAQKLFG